MTDLNVFDDPNYADMLTAKLLPSIASPAVLFETHGKSDRLDASLIGSSGGDAITRAKHAELDVIRLTIRYVQYPSDSLKRQMTSALDVLQTSYESLSIVADTGFFANHVQMLVERHLNPENLADWLALAPSEEREAELSN